MYIIKKNIWRNFHDKLKIYSLDEDFELSKLTYNELNMLINIIILKNKGFDYFTWRQSVGLCNSYSAYKDVHNYCLRWQKINIDYDFVDYVIKNSRFANQDGILNIINDLFMYDTIKMVELDKKSSCFCRRIKKYPYSEIYIENGDKDIDYICNFFHEIGHAVFNYYMKTERLQCDREYEEYIAHFFEGCIMTDSSFLTVNEWINRAKQKVNFHLTEASYLNNLFLNGNEYEDWESKKTLFDRCANQFYHNYQHEFVDKIVACPDFFKYPFDSYFSISGLKKIIDEMSLDQKYNDLLEVIYENIN